MDPVCVTKPLSTEMKPGGISKNVKAMKLKKMPRWKIMGVLYILQLLSVLLFSLGFFLTRAELTTESNPTAHTNAYHGLKRFNKAVIILVDALRFDFLSPLPWPPLSAADPCPMRKQPEDSNRDDEDSRPHKFQNKVPAVCDLLTSRPNNSLLLKFIADPPTTTMQRIKGMMTGSLPTFIDFSRNFGSDKISEDNVANQLRLQNRSIVFMGDDTWMSLLGQHFSLAYPYPSFNVMDLDTVDNGVNEHLFVEMTNKSSNWNLIIAHLLGLDHAGHRYNLHNRAIVQKLKQLNQLIEDVVAAMDDDTILVVMGDHGMTSSGDHGGETEAEVEAALFLHSKNEKRSLTSSTSTSLKFEAVSQIDLVPSLSLLLGSSIPFSNLGKVISQLFPDEQHLTQALDMNIAQLSRYIEAEASLSDKRDPTKFKTNAEKLEYLSGVADNYRKIWTTFDTPIIILGIFSMVTAACLHLCFVYFLIRHPSSDSQDSDIYGNENNIVRDYMALLRENCVTRRSHSSWERALIMLASAIFPSLLLSFHYPIAVAMVIGVTLPCTLYSMTVIWKYYQVISRKIHLCVLAFPGLLFGAISASNSFILNEPLCLIHISNAFTLLIMLYGSRVVNYKISSSLEAACVAFLCSFLSRNLISRPEDSEICDWLKPLSSLSPEMAYWRVVLTSILLIVFVLLITIRKLRELLQSNENGSFAAFWFCMGVPLCSGCIIAYWFLGLQPHEVYESQPALIKVVFPRISYLIISIGFTIFICDPIMVSIKPRSNTLTDSVIDVDVLQAKPTSEIIPHIAKNLFKSSHTINNSLLANGSLANHTGGSKTKIVAKRNSTAQDQHHNKRLSQVSNGTVLQSPANGGSAHTLKGVAIRNGAMKANHFNSSSSTASSSRSSSHSNVTIASVTQGAPNKISVNSSSDHPSASISRKGPQGNGRNTFHTQALHSSAVLSWHLISTPVTLFLYLMAGNGPSIGLTLLLFHIRSLCHLINTAMHPHHDTVGPAPSQESCESPSSHSANSCLNCNGEFKCVSACRIASLKTHHNHQNDTTEIYAHGESETLPVQEEDLQSSISGIFSSGAQGRKMPCDFEPMSVAAAMGGILFAFLGSYYFYVTGHQLAIASIRFETGFIGFVGDFNSFVVPGFLVLCNTFCAQLLANVFVPMILYTHFAGSTVTSCSGSNQLNCTSANHANHSSPNANVPRVNTTEDAHFRYSLQLIDREEKVNGVMWIFFVSCSLTYCLKLTMTMLFTTILRYHLMAYRIFVPNLMFQIVIYAVVLISQCLVYAAHKWLMSKTKRFMNSFNKSTS